MFRALMLLLACLVLMTHASAQSNDRQSGLVTGELFEGWLRFVRPEGMRATSMRLRKGDSVRITFPAPFVPASGDPEVYFAYGWTHGDAAAEYLVTLDDRDRRTIVLSVAHSVARSIPVTPGRQSIHVFAPLRNPAPGTYAILTVTKHGKQISTERENITILARTTPLISQVRARNRAQRGDFQTVVAGHALPIPLDFLITDVDGTNPANISLQQIDTEPGIVTIMRAGMPIGKVTASAGVVLVPEQAPRIGVVRIAARAPATPGRGFVVAHLDGGTRAQYTFTVRR